jgi:hypothetical protein
MIESFPLRFLLVVLAGWVNRHQLDVIEYLREENRVLTEQIGKRRLRLTDAQGIDNRLIKPEPRGPREAEVCRRTRLGGLLRYYYRAA